MIILFNKSWKLNSLIMADDFIIQESAPITKSCNPAESVGVRPQRITMRWIFLPHWLIEYIIQWWLSELHWVHIKNEVTRFTVRVADIGIVPKFALFLFFDELEWFIDVGNIHAVEEGGHKTPNRRINHLLRHIIIQMLCLLPKGIDVEVTNTFKN